MFQVLWALTDPTPREHPMPRTTQATIALIVTLVTIALIAVLNMWQSHTTQDQLIQLKNEVKKMTLLQQDIKDQLKTGVAYVGSPKDASLGRTSLGTDQYAKSLEDKDNFLQPRSQPMTSPDAKVGGTLRKIMTSDPKGFNWLLENSVDVANLQDLVHDTLADRDMHKPDSWVPRLAHKIVISEDYKVYTIHIRKGVKWHTPALPNISDEKFAWLRKTHELKAEDFKFYFDLIKNPQVEVAAARAYYKDVDRVEIIDDYTYKVVWTKKTYQSLSATLSSYPMPKWLFTKNEDGTPIEQATLGLKFNKHWASAYPVGTGRYKFLSYTKGESLKLERNENFWGPKPPMLGIDNSIVKDPETQLLKFKAKATDYTTLTATQYNTEVLKGKDTPFTRGEFEYKKYDFLGYSYLGWNIDKPMFKDKRVRRAMTHAFNRESIIKNVYFGLGTLQTGPFYYKHTANNPAVKPYLFDLKKAKSLLAQAGWKDSNNDGVLDKNINGTKTPFKFVITSYANSKEWTAALSIFKEDLRKIGVQMDFSPVDWPTMQKKMNEKKFDAFTGGWGLDWSIDPYQLWHSSQADEPKGSNRVAFRSKRGDEIIEELRATFDPSKRQTLLHEFHMLLHEEQPYTFFRAPKGVFAWNPRLKNPKIQMLRPHLNPLTWYLDGPPK